MTNEVLDKLIDWCRMKMQRTKLTGKYLDGYTEAMLAVMSRLHAEKVQQNNGAVPVYGQWISQGPSRTLFMCNVCRARNYEGHEKYCPNCGAKMDLEE